MRITPGKPATFLLNDVCEWSGATPAQVEHWVKHGAIIPQQQSAGRGSFRVFSFTNVIEAAIARESAAAGLSVKQIQVTLAQLRDRLERDLLEELRASGAFIRFVEIVKAIATINGPGPNYAQWCKDVDALTAGWQRERVALDEGILRILAASRAAERHTDERPR